MSTGNLTLPVYTSTNVLCWLKYDAIGGVTMIATLTITWPRVANR